eukprot:SAG31_NODE_306_length_17979_cov_7.825447_6_plen_104_part_00
MARVVPTPFDSMRPSVRNTVTMQGEMEEGTPGTPGELAKTTTAAVSDAVQSGKGGAGKILVSLTLDGSTAIGRLNGQPLSAGKRWSAQKGLGSSQYAVDSDSR